MTDAAEGRNWPRGARTLAVVALCGAIYLGYSDDRLGEQDVPLQQSDRTVFFKVGYAWLP